MIQNWLKINRSLKNMTAPRLFNKKRTRRIKQKKFLNPTKNQKKCLLNLKNIPRRTAQTNKNDFILTENQFDVI
jgi:GTP-dependent phosphoenolpyruvate carboxykinase